MSCDHLTDLEWLVNAEPERVMAVLDTAAGPEQELAAAVYRASEPVRRKAGAGVRRQLLALDAARYGARDLAARLTAVEVAGEPQSAWDVVWATGWTKGSSIGAPVAGHSAAVEEIATVAAGEREFVVSSGADDAVRVWDAASGEQIGGPVTGHECCASVAAIHLDGMGDTGTRTLLILGEWDNGLAVFDLLTGRKMAEGATTGALALAGLVVDGRPLVFTGGGGEGYGLARVWDLAADTWSGELRPGHLDAVVAVAAVQDGPRLVGVTGSEDCTACVWDLSTGTRIGAPFTGHTGSVRAVAATAVDGRLLAVTGGNDQTARLWDAKTAEQISVLLTGHGTVTCVASAVIDHRALAAIGTMHGTVRVWDLGADTQVGTDLLFPMPVDAVGITPTGRIAVGFGHEVAVFTAHRNDDRIAE